MSSASFFDFLDQSLAALRAELPAAYDALVGELEGRRLAMTADGERRVVSFGRSGLEAHAQRERVDFEVAFDRGAVLDLVDGRISLPRAILTERIALRGGTDSIARFDLALQNYVQGAVRCPSLPALLGSFRDD